VPETITPATITVPFEGEGSGIGELTWGQRELLRAVRLVGHWIPIGGVTPQLPETWTVDDLVVSVQFIMRRHQSLRTRLVFDEHGGAKQVVAASGELVIELYEVGPDGDPKAFADALSDRYSRDEFDDEHDWPLRVGVVRQRIANEQSVLRYAVFIYNHLMVDGMGLQALLIDLASMDPETHEAPPVTALQPLELATRQGSASGRRQSAAALRHWESVARAVADRESVAGDPQEPPYRELWFRSPAGMPAMRAVAARCGTDTGPVLLAASATALSRVTGISPLALLTIVNNRFRPGLADAVMQLAQRSPCLLEIEGQRFEQVVAQAQRATLRAGMHGYLDPDECDRMLERVARERGVPVDLSCYYNDRRAPEPQESNSVTAASSPEQVSALIAGLLPQTSLRWGQQLGEQDNKFFLHINDSPDALDFLICADSRFLGPAGLERCAREFEAVLVAAATETALPMVAAGKGLI
jgi:hypothetical protein